MAMLRFKLVKKISLVLCLLPLFIHAADVGIGWSTAKLQQPVIDEDNNRTIDADNHNIQVSLGADNWLMGIALSTGDNSKLWSENRLDTTAKLEFSSHEWFFNYYWNNWIFNTAFGKSNTDYQFNNVRHYYGFNTLLVDRNDAKWFESNDSFIEFGTNYLYDLPEGFNDFSLSFELGATYYDTTGKQGSSVEFVQIKDDPRLAQFLESKEIQIGVKTANEFEISETLWIYSLGMTLDYSFAVLSQDALVSFWVENEMFSQKEGSIVASRLRNNNRIIRRELPLSESGEKTELQSLNSYGIDFNLAVTSNLSASVSVLDSDQSDLQWQIGLFYWF